MLRRISVHLLTAIILCLLMAPLPARTQQQELFVSEILTGNIIRFDTNGNNLGVFASAAPNRAYGLAYSKTGILYVASGSTIVKRFSSTGVFLSSWTVGTSYCDGIALDAVGNLYASDYLARTINRFDPNGNSMGVFASTVIYAEFLAIDGSGNIYVTDADSHVRKFTADGTDLGYFVTDINYQGGVAFDAAGNVYVCERGSNRIRRFSSNGIDLGVFASTGLSDPITLAFDAAGNLYVANFGNGTIRKFAPDGTDLGNFATGIDHPVGLAFRPVLVTIGGIIALQSTQNAVQSIEFTFRPTTGSAFTRTATLNFAGGYSISGIPAGQYTVSIKGAKWLQKNITVDARFGNVTNANAALKAGDANNDNVVDVADLLLMINHYNQQKNTPANNPNYLEAADFNCDDMNDVADLLIVIGNYNKQGD